MLGLKLGLSCVPQAGGGGGGDTVLEEIDESGNTEITEYVNNDVIEVTGNVTFEGCSGLADLGLDSLHTVGLQFVVTETQITSLSLPAFASVDELIVGNNVLMTAFLTPSLEDVTTSMLVSENNALEAMLLPSNLVGAVTLSANQSLTTITVPVPLNHVLGNFNASSCALDQASVDAILVKLASLDGTGDTTLFSDKDVNLSGGSNAVPSGTGLAAKTTLEGRGCNVSVNE